MDAKTVPSIHGLPWRRQTALVEMDVGRSEISSPTQVADFLVILFPSLRNIEAYLSEAEREDPDEDSDCLMWYRTNRILDGETSARSGDEADEDEWNLGLDDLEYYY